MPGLLRVTSNYLRVTKRLAPRRHSSLTERLGRLDDRLVFVVGSPRSGTTFLAEAVGSVPGFLDLGEVAPVKAAIPELVCLPPAEASRRLRRTLTLARRAGLVGSVRAVEQTPEMAYLVDVAARAYPRAQFVHIVRDGRDVVCSLLEKRWLGSGAQGADDAGLAFGQHARHWVERDRADEFVAASDARRAAWAWRSYVSAVRGAKVPVHELRYEALAADPVAAASALARYLGASESKLAGALSLAHQSSVGRHRTDLSPEQLADVEGEAGDLLRELGYL